MLKMSKKVKLHLNDYFIKLSKKFEDNSLNSFTRGLERRTLANFRFNIEISISHANMHNFVKFHQFNNNIF